MIFLAVTANMSESAIIAKMTVHYFLQMESSAAGAACLLTR